MNPKKYGLLVCLLAYILAQGNAYAQTSSVEYPEVLPPSPEASAFAKYGELPVSTYSGTPNIEIPIFNASYGDINLPIALQYHASGIKVDEEASWVGLGWVLQAGGVITRTIMGKDDFHNPTYFTSSLPDFEKSLIGSYPGYTGPSIFNFDCDFEYLNFLNIPDNLQSNNSGLDFQPDQYTYNFGGFAGTFAVKRSTSGDPETIFANNFEKLQFKPIWNISEVTIEGFEVTDPDGFVYTFEEMEFNYELSPPSPSAWYLTSIESSAGKRIDLSYIRRSANVSNIGAVRGTGITPICVVTGGSGTIGGCPTNFSSEVIFQTPRQYDIPVLSEIDFHSGVVKFHSTNTQRLDLPGGNRLNSIEVFMKKASGSLESLPAKKFQFAYDYLKSSGLPSQWDIDGATQFFPYTDEHLGWRLKLEKVIEASNDGSIPLGNCPTHSFSYIESPSLPAKTSLARDHWGYFNGKTGNTELHPEFKGIIAQFFNQYYEFDGADRKASPNHSKAFSLEQITYPTGGTTSITYEGNTFDYLASSEHDDYADYVSEQSSQIDNGTIVLWQPGTVDFTVGPSSTPNGFSEVEIEVTFVCDQNNGCPTNGDQSVAYARVYKSNWQEVPNSILTLDNASCLNDCNERKATLTLNLAAGDYFVKAATNHANIPYVDVRVIQGTIANIIQGGGLRVSELITHDGEDVANDIHRIFEYHYWEDRDGDGTDEEYSYGRRLARPIYGRFSGSSQWEEGIDGGGTTQCLETLYLQFNISANSLAPLRGYGGMIGYDKVVEKFGRNGTQTGIHGRSEYHYHNQPDVVKSYFFRRPPGLPNFPHEESSLNGMLKLQEDYSSTDQLVRKLENSYSAYSTKEAIMGIYQEAYNVSSDGSCGVIPSPCQVMSFIYPVAYKTWPRLFTSAETIYASEGSGSVKTSTLFLYDANLKQVRSKSMSNSDGSVYRTEFRYAEEGGTGVPAEMYDPLNPNFKHMLGIVVEETSLLTGSPIGRTVKNFQYDVAGDRILMGNTQMFPTANSEMIQMNYEYDDDSNLEQVQRDVGQPQCFLWGYHESLPIARVINAEEREVAYTSFEEEGETFVGNWIINSSNGGWGSSNAKTGRFSFDLTPERSLGRYIPTTGTYILSYWVKGANPSTNLSRTLIHSSEPDKNGFVYYEYEIYANAGSTFGLTGTGYNVSLDEVRLYPEKAQMSTLCYDEDHMIHTQTDVNNFSIYYTYDGLNRLVEVRDQNGFLVQEYDYKYYTE
ncbi:MAG: hypothetical protein AAF587_09050 [Bacteroidota bacterium]